MKDKLYLNDDWFFAKEFNDNLLEDKCTTIVEHVRLPHTVAITPYNYFSETLYQSVSGYRKILKTDAGWKNKRVLLTVGAAAHCSELYVNSQLVMTHNCGYTSFTADITEYLRPVGRNNIVVIKLNSRESVDVPPFGNVIDYLTYGGIYRDVYLEIKNQVYINNISIKTNKNHFTSEICLNTDKDIEEYSITQKIIPYGNKNAIPSAEIITGLSGIKTLTAADASPVQAWSLENPILYELSTELHNNKGKIVDTKYIRFGFRDIKFDSTGFYLNNKKIKIRGLNRHQSYPYVGYAMPKNIQKEDADILKFKLGLNEVRTSHYPQSEYFIERCDEIGLLVFMEIPGWQYIGGQKWKEQAITNVTDMVTEFKNHPSIFMWGVRINESQDDDELYKVTNKIARELDSTRPTAGVRYLTKSNLLEDVYTFNDFSHAGKSNCVLNKKKVTNTDKGYMITEYNGHMFSTKMFDNEARRTEHALRHANVLNAVAANNDIAGSSGWCAFDYNTHKNFGSGDHICYHGVMDMFRNPKIAAYVYASQEESTVTSNILEINSSFDPGDYDGNICGPVWIFTNADNVKMYINNVFIKNYTHKDSPYKNLKYGPILVDDFIGTRLVNEDHINAKYTEELKRIISTIQKFGRDSIPLFTKILIQKNILLRRITTERLWQLFYKYTSGTGTTSITYKFEAFKDSKLIKTLIRTSCRKIYIEAEATVNTLIETNSYDVTCVHIRATDENGNIQSYYQEPLVLTTQGPIEIIGPKIISFKGGQTGTYVKTIGKPGKAQLMIKDNEQNETIINFIVKIKN